MAGRGQGIVVWSFVGLCEKEVSHFADSEEKLSSYTERGEKRGLRGRIMLRRFFSSLCRISWGRQKTSNSDPQLKVGLVHEPGRWFERGKHHAQIKRCTETCRGERKLVFSHILYCDLDAVKKPN